MQLIEFDRHDHPESCPGLPRVGCGVCGRQVQPELDIAHWDDIDPELQLEAMEAMARWSHAHDDSHSDAEHAEHQRRLEEASR